MRTGRSVTVSGGGASQKNFWGKKIRKKIWIKKKIWLKKFELNKIWIIPPHPQIGDPPKKLETPPPPEKLETPWKIGDPRKIGDPLKNWRPPEKLETPLKNWRPPLWTEFLTHAYENITLAQLRCGR